MKINEGTYFSYPVLREDAGDYLSGEFSLEVTAVSEQETTDQVTLEYTAALTETNIRDAISRGSAAVGIFVTCLDTYFSRLIPLGLEGGRFSFDPGALVGRVEIRPLIWARIAIDSYSQMNCHPEFGGGEITLEAGSVLALGHLQVLNIGREKLAQMETIFSIVEDGSLSDDQISLNLDDERIQVLAATNIYQHINQLREKSFGRSIVLNSIFLPAVMQVLDILKSGDGDYEGKRWHRIFKAKCEHMQINLQAPDLWIDAQKLLRNPFSQVRNEKIFLGE